MSAASAPAAACIPSRALLRAAGRALGEFRMIRPGDRLLLALSGGKDSLTLLHILRAVQQRVQIPFELAAATIDPCITGYDPRFLKDYLLELGIPYHYIEQPIIERAQQTMRNDSFCAYCARMRRGALYRVAREGGYNVLALGHHLDDIAESFFMSAFHEGRLHTMRAHYVNDAGDVRVIRPMVYVRERQLIDFAREAGLPALQDNCPACFNAPTERAHMKAWLGAEEQRHRRLFLSLRHALRPLLGEVPE
ncbi:MAG TPA: ATP-binding protein [Acidiferrobacteraceae bacterium]|nr:ATP-binding protein [Acidiferrobacteraceae bacterium]